MAGDEGSGATCRGIQIRIICDVKRLCVRGPFGRVAHATEGGAGAASRQVDSEKVASLVIDEQIVFVGRYGENNTGGVRVLPGERIREGREHHQLMRRTEVDAISSLVHEHRIWHVGEQDGSTHGSGKQLNRLKVL